MLQSPPFRRPAPAGITLLEVLISMFILAVGILSVLGLFTAGRELSARAELRGRALAYAAGQGTALADSWIDVTQWQYHDGTDFRWVRWDTNPWNPNVRLPVIVDPWGLCADWATPVTPNPPWNTSMSGSAVWNWTTHVPLISSTAGLVTPRPFSRITLPRVARGLMGSTDAITNPVAELPLAREETNAIFADPDDIEFKTNPVDPEAIPLNDFELGRRKRGTELVPALFIAAADGSANGGLNSTALMKRTLLIFHKPVPDYEKDSAGRQWPTGSLEFVALQLERDLMRLQLTRVPNEDTAIRRALRPGNWLLLTNRRDSTVPGEYTFDACWRRMTSVTPEVVSSNEKWLVVLSQDVPAAWPRGNWDPASLLAGGPRSHLRVDWNNAAGVLPTNFGRICAYAFESLVHVEPLPDAKLVNAQ